MDPQLLKDRQPLNGLSSGTVRELAMGSRVWRTNRQKAHGLVTSEPVIDHPDPIDSSSCISMHLIRNLRQFWVPTRIWRTEPSRNTPLRPLGFSPQTLTRPNKTKLPDFRQGVLAISWAN